MTCRTCQVFVLIEELTSSVKRRKLELRQQSRTRYPRAEAAKLLLIVRWHIALAVCKVHPEENRCSRPLDRCSVNVVTQEAV